MSDQIISCSSCGTKLKLKEDRALPNDAKCPKCLAPLAIKKSAPAPTPTKPVTSKSPPVATPTSTSRPTTKKPRREEVIEDDFEEEEEYTAAPRRKPTRSKSRSSGGIPGWLIGVLCGLLVAIVGGGAFIFLRKGGTPDSGTPVAVTNSQNEVATPSVPVAAPNSASVTSAQPAMSPSNTLPMAQATNPVPQSPATLTPVQSPAAVPAPAAAPAPNGQIAKYHPLPDSTHNYNFEVIADLDRYREKSSGSCMLTTEKQVSSGFSVRPSTPEQGTGTGFVLATNGVIATCAHVVDGSSSIEVVIGGQTYPAKVLHSDTQTDLAIIKIEANGLAPVSLANSDQLQLGQPLRVIGFPLSDVLGTGIKITQGAVSGILEQDGQRRIQTDATINPGNSGGPVFNTRGEVVGIASAKLSGVAVSQVGFCVPSSTLATLLQQNGIPLPPVVPGQEMETTALVQKVSPSVAFIKVSGDAPGDAAVAFRYTANMHVRRQTLEGRPIIGGGISLPTSDFGTFSITDNGTPVNMSDGEYAPIIMSRLPMIPFVELSKTGQPAWTKQREISIVREERSKSPFGSRRGFYNELFPDQKPKVVAVQKALEVEKFQVTSDNAEKLVLARTYELKTTDGSEPGIELTGTGTWTFDRTVGMPAGSETKGTYKVTIGGVTVTIPYSVSVTLWTKEQTDQFNERVAAIAKGTPGANPNQSLEGATAEAPIDGDATHVIQAKSWGYKTTAISPDSQKCAFTNQEKGIFIHDLATGKEIDSKLGLDGLGTPSQSSYSPDGKYLLVGGQEGVIRIWNVDDKGEIDHLGDYVGHASNIEALKILDDSRTVISSDQKNRVRVWTLDDQKDKFAIPDLKEQTIEIGVSADGKNGFLVATNSLVTTFHLTDGKVTTSAPVFKSHFGNVAHFSPDGKTLFMPDTYEVTCHRVNSKKSPDAIDVGETIWDIDYCAKTSEIIAAGNGKIHIIDFKEETRTGILSTGAKITGYVKGIAISPDGRYVVAIGGPIGQSLLIFDRESKQKKATPAAETDTPDGNADQPETDEEENPFKAE